MSQEILLTVQSAATLNEFLREELPKVLNAECSQAKDCGAADQNSLQDQDLRRDLDGLQDQNVGSAAKSAVSNSKIRRLLFSGNVMVAASPERKALQDQNGGKKALQAQNQRGGFFVCKNPAFSLKKNARVKVSLDQEKFFYEKQNDDIKFELDSSRVLYEDDAIIVVNKPPRFPTEPTFVQDRDNLRAAVIRYLHKKIGLEKNPPYCGIVHRLDRDTSGVILFSKRRDCNAALFAAFDSSRLEKGGANVVGKTKRSAGSFGLGSGLRSAQERAAKKIYVAVCEPAALSGLEKDFVQGQKAGAFKVGDNFSVQNYLGRVSLKSQAAKWGFVPKEKGGKFARTDFKVLEKSGGRLFVQAELFTGRTHQIRVHLSQRGLPILGDQLYGGAQAERIFLHALSLELPHPLTGKPLRFEAPLPPEFSALL